MTTQNEVAVNGGGKQYGTKLTALGEAAIAENILAGTRLDVVEIAAGDGGGAYYEPTAEQTALVREVWRGEIAAYERNPLNPKMVDIKGVIPSADGGFTVRELGVFDRSGTLIGVCNTPDMEKARPDSGAGGKLDVIMHLIVTDANALNIVVKPSLDTVSLEDVTQLLGGKQDKLTGQPGQVPVFDEDGNLEAQDFSGAAVFAFTAENWGPPASWAPEEPAEEAGESGAAEGSTTEDGAAEDPPAYDGSLGYEIVLPAAAHKRKNGDFGFQVFHQIEGRYITNTWAALGTGADYDGEAGTVTLSSSDAYPGKILFVG